MKAKALYTACFQPDFKTLVAIAVGSCFLLKSLWLTIPVGILIFGSLTPFTRSTDIPAFK
jgi:hypothetical protein